MTTFEEGYTTLQDYEIRPFRRSSDIKASIIAFDFIIPLFGVSTSIMPFFFFIHISDDVHPRSFVTDMPFRSFPETVILFHFDSGRKSRYSFPVLNTVSILVLPRMSALSLSTYIKIELFYHALCNITRVKHNRANPYAKELYANNLNHLHTVPYYTIQSTLCVFLCLHKKL